MITFHYKYLISNLIVLSNLIRLSYTFNQRIPFLTDGELEKAGELTDADIKELGSKAMPNLYNKSYFEGDIALNDHFEIELTDNKYLPQNSGLHWPNSRVPYILDYDYNQRQRLLLGAAIKFFERKTCIRWVKKESSDLSWVSITGSGIGCFTDGVGKWNKGVNVINLDDNCFQLEAIIHEMMHRIGFIHEQARPDRDNYVQLYLENIFEGNENQFETKPSLFSKEYSLPYDIHSIMHYFESAFSSNGKPTIVARNGQKLSCDHSGLQCPTQLDIIKINTVYKCSQMPNKSMGKCTTLYWKNVDLITPSDNPLIGGYDLDGKSLYICRTEYDGNEIPGNTKLNGFGCAINYAEREYVINNNYKVLINPKREAIDWISIKGLSKDQLRDAMSRKRDEIYIGRCDLLSDNTKAQVVRKVHKKFNYSLSGEKSRNCQNFEILICYKR